MVDSSFLFSSLPVSVETLCSAQELMEVRDLLVRENGRWLSGSEIARRLGWARSRTAEKVRRAVKELQLLGVPIVSGHAGFTIATSQRMIDLCVQREEARREGLERSIIALRSIRVDERQVKL